MRVWLDGQCLQTTSLYRGIGRYTLNLITGLARYSELELIVSLNGNFSDETRTARQLLSKILPAHQVKIWHGLPNRGQGVEGQTLARRLSEAALSHHVACLTPDIAISASPFEGSSDAAIVLPPEAARTFKMVGIFYDAIPLRFPEHYLETNAEAAFFKSRLQSYAEFDHVVAISQFAKSEIEALVKGVSATVIGAGVSEAFRKKSQDSAAMAAQSRRSFVLYVGAFDWRKNVAALLHGFAGLPQTLRERTDLRLVGPDQPVQLEALRLLWRKLGLPPEHLIIENDIADEDLIALYQNAELLVQPSLMEGFGLTALEAMACGTPVIVSRGGALEEVVGRPDQLGFDPLDPTEITLRMKSILESNKVQGELGDYGRDRAQTFGWDKTANALVSRMRQMHTAARPAHFTLAEIRQSTLARLPQGLQNRDRLPALLAAAEPIRRHGRRLLVDVTMTARTDMKTGIQRVVTRIAENWQTGGIGEFDEVILVYADDKTGFYRTAINHKGEPEVPQKLSTNRIVFQRGDTVLMLDSSWQFHTVHKALLGKLHLLDVEIIFAVYDLLPLQAAAFFQPDLVDLFAQWLASATSIATGFVCISATVVRELEAHFLATDPPWDIQIGHWDLGAERFERPDRADVRKAGAGARFLMVGSIDPRKGHLVALRALERLVEKGVDVKLVIVGRPAWGGGAIAKALRQFERRGWIEWLDDADDAALANQYATVDGLIAASYAEGFGLPLVEAMRAGVPVLASDIPVFRDIAQRCTAMTFFPAGNDKALAAQMVESLGTGRLASEVIWPTWQESAAQLGRMLAGGPWPLAHMSKHTKGAKGEVSKQVPMKTATADPRTGELRLVQGPAFSPEQGTIEMIIAVTNTSNALWPPAELRNPASAGVFVRYVSRTGGGASGDIAGLVPLSAGLPTGSIAYVRIGREGPPACDPQSLHVTLVDIDGNKLGNELRVHLP